MKQNGRLHIDIGKQSGIRFIDFFADHTSMTNELKLIDNHYTTITESLYLKNLLTPVTCPRCSSKKVVNNARGIFRRCTQRFSGRVSLSCPDCGWSEMVKVRSLDKGIVCVAIAVLVVLAIFSIHWLKAYS